MKLFSLVCGNMASGGAGDHRPEQPFAEMQHQNQFVYIYDRRVGNSPEVKLPLSGVSSYESFNERVKKVRNLMLKFMQKTLS